MSQCLLINLINAFKIGKQKVLCYLRRKWTTVLVTGGRCYCYGTVFQTCVVSHVDYKCMFLSVIININSCGCVCVTIYSLDVTDFRAFLCIMYVPMILS